MRGRKPRLHLPYVQWPPADQLLWERAMGNNDPFSDAAGGRFAKSSQYNCLMAWRRFLGWLASHEPAALELAPMERLTMERIRSFAAHLAASNNARSVASQVDALYQAARVMIPERDWTWLKGMKARLYKAAPASPRPGPVITSLQLLDLGQQLMDESNPMASPISMERAILYRDGFIFAFVAFIPIRPKNLTALEIGRHLVREGDRWWIIILGEEAKTGTPIEFPLPEILEPYLAIYLDSVRPRMLPRPGCTALWVSSQGDGPLTYASVAYAFRRHSISRLGFRISPHDARDAAATTWAIFAPDKIGVARDLLTHRDLRTTIRHYNRAKGIEASRAHCEVIAGMRRKLARRS